MRIVNATVLDVAGGQLVPDQTIVIENGRIAALETGKKPGSNARVIDAHGLTVMPGLIDAHVHVMAAHLDLARLWNWPASYTTALGIIELRALLGRGFTTVRDVAGADYGIAKAVAEGLVVGPRVLFAGPALSQTGGHGDLRDAGDDGHHRHSTEFTVVCDGVDEVRRATRNELRKGAHHIKLMLSGGVASPTDRIDSVQFSIDEISAAVEEAKNVGRYVVAHAYTVETVNRALRSGVRSIEHGNLIDSTSVSLLIENGAFYVPTLITYVAMSEYWDRAGLPPSGREKLNRVLDHGLGALELAHKSGVQIAFGTDLLGEFRSHQLREFLLRSEVQQPIDIIRSATTTAAKLINMVGEVGTVAAGASADLLVLEGNPLTDIAVLTKPDTALKAVIKEGMLVKNVL